MRKGGGENDGPAAFIPPRIRRFSAARRNSGDEVSVGERWARVYRAGFIFFSGLPLLEVAEGCVDYIGVGRGI